MHPASSVNNLLVDKLVNRLVDRVVDTKPQVIQGLKACVNNWNKNLYRKEIKKINRYIVVVKGCIFF